MKANSQRTRKKTFRLERSRAGLLVIDVQERLLPSIFEADRIIRNALRMIKGANILGVPVLVTEQYRKGLGGTHNEISSSLKPFEPLQKLAFSACGAEGFLPALKGKKVRDVLICGIEAHVCISQTCLDLLDEGFRVFIVADAISSRTAENVTLALQRMRDAGAVMVSTEMALFELLEQAGTDDFRQVLALVK